MPVDQLPGMVAMRERRPVHASFHMNGLDGIPRPIQATAIPLTDAGGGGDRRAGRSVAAG